MYLTFWRIWAFLLLITCDVGAYRIKHDSGPHKIKTALRGAKSRAPTKSFQTSHHEDHKVASPYHKGSTIKYHKTDKKGSRTKTGVVVAEGQSDYTVQWSNGQEVCGGGMMRALHLALLHARSL